MKNLINTACAFYGIGVAGIGFQQFIYSDFRPVLLPPWPLWMHASMLAYVTGGALVIAGICILLLKNIKEVSLLLGLLFLMMFLIFHVPYLLFINENSPRQLGLWTNPLKELALSGGAFVIAGFFREEDIPSTSKSTFLSLLEKLIPAGRIFFALTMIAFGIDHFLYAEFVATLVPSWIPGHTFWTYFAAVALIGSGVAIILKIKLELVGRLLALMLFLWFIMLHIPRAIVAPPSDNGNEITSVFQALAFSGIALAIACMAGNQKFNS
ncbi:MAG: hypothetical protein ABIN67_19900 [Ferruginibacter sp.]